MRKIEQHISQEGFFKLKEVLLEAELAGYSADACAAMALTSISLRPEPFVEVVFVVDPKLGGPV
jgi:hypothetical protein